MSKKDKWYDVALNHESVGRLLNDNPNLDINDINILEDGTIQHIKGFQIEGYKSISYVRWCYEQGDNMF